MTTAQTESKAIFFNYLKLNVANSLLQQMHETKFLSNPIDMPNDTINSTSLKCE